MNKVLVVDDSAVDRSLVGGLLGKDAGLAVEFAVHGLDALEHIQRASPDLVVSDLMMPKMDGLQLVAEVRRKFPLVPVILMTSKGNEEIAVQALQAGAASYVPKAKMGLQLIDTIHKVLAVAGRDRGHNRLMGCVLQSHYTFELGNDPSLFRPLVKYLQDSVSNLGIGDISEQTRLGVALEEALANALYHGNLEIDSTLREQNDKAYHAQIERRSHEPPYGTRRIHVDARLSREEAIFVVRDEGGGFNPAALPDPTDPANLERASGRGILLMRTFMDEVTYNALGNEVTLRKCREPLRKHSG